MFKAFLMNTAFDFVKEYLLSDKNIEHMRSEFRDFVEEVVLDSENDWDDDAADALFRFMGFKR